jgi:hypothetical protein
MPLVNISFMAVLLSSPMEKPETSSNNKASGPAAVCLDAH